MEESSGQIYVYEKRGGGGCLPLPQGYIDVYFL